MANVTAGKGKISGYAFRAPLGTALPTDSTTALDAAFEGLGYISEDGLTSSNSPESETVVDLNKTPILSLMSSREDTWSATFVEALNVEVLKMVYGESNVSGTLSSGITVTVNADSLTAAIYVFEFETTEGGSHRIVLPKAIPSEIGERTFVADQVEGYEVTLTALADSSGNTHYEYIKQS